MIVEVFSPNTGKRNAGLNNYTFFSYMQMEIKIL